MYTVSGLIISKVVKEDCTEGVLQCEKGRDLRFQAFTMPLISAGQQMTIGGEWADSQLLITRRYILHAKLIDVLPQSLMKQHTCVVRRIGELEIEAASRHPELLDELLGAHSALSANIKRWIINRYSVPNLMNYLKEFGLTEKQYRDLCQDLGPSVIDLLEKNPYLLTHSGSIPFSAADRLASRQGLSAKSELRVKGAIRYVHRQYLNGGSSYITSREFEYRVRTTLGPAFTEEQALFEIDQFVRDKSNAMIRSEGGLLFDRHLFFAELQIAQRLRDLTAWQMRQPESLDAVLLRLVSDGFIPVLDEDQQAAIEAFFAHPVLFVQGEAGTGKTSWIKYLLAVLQQMYPEASVKLAALTGKAARRLETVTGAPAQTIHKLLGRGVETNSRILYHHKKKPLPTDVLIVDEASMINEYLWRDILWAIDRGTKLVFVGDPNQLEPIGPGRPFLDLIEYGFPAATLKRHYRNDSSILQMGKAILDGNGGFVPAASGEEIEFIPLENISEVREEVTNQYAKYGGTYPVVTMYREQFSLGVDRLNPYMKQRLNPGEPGAEARISLHDPVIQTRNTEIVSNGDLGVITDIDADKGIVILFDTGVEVTYSTYELPEFVELAYALTTAKTQGSEYEGVIIPLVDIKTELVHRHSMWYRNSLYTAITRAKNKLILIGSYQELSDGIKRTGVRRNTRLKNRLEAYLGWKEQTDTDKPIRDDNQ
ncbi:hypothetical protein SD71_04555 [Cohnella kolymensis]|uniref:Uncharacterized protein n=1 Tax=Cohnella kolymensis TaxID=1590652 RepID=A0ABR5A7D4_9BACL|nr:AAA family ATPase [Cohnella kolymensis]KIL36975.1 hypothetical protein SD71_04555 [Cohnella kolymensis]